MAEERGLHIHRDKDLRGRQVPVSAVTGQGLDGLLSAIQDVLNQSRVTRTLILPATAGKAMAWLHSHVSVADRADEDETVKMVVVMSQSEEDKFRHIFPDIKWPE